MILNFNKILHLLKELMILWLLVKILLYVLLVKAILPLDRVPGLFRRRRQMEAVEVHAAVDQLLGDPRTVAFPFQLLLDLEGVAPAVDRVRGGPRPGGGAAGQEGNQHDDESTTTHVPIFFHRSLADHR